MTNFDSYELLSREDLIETIRTFKAHQGIGIIFHGKSTSTEIAKKVRPRVTRRISTLHVGSSVDQAKNMLIEGENLQAMVTLYRYRGQVDFVLTDPPYNTGNHFRYNDRWDEDPNDPDLGTLVTMEDGSRHTKWMKAMMPRLQMMKAMLKPQGVLAICIDENELFHLGMMLDEIFGEENRLAIINWQKSYSAKHQSGHVSTATEYVLVYAKSKEAAKTGMLGRTNEMNARYRNPDGDEHIWKGDNLSAQRHKKPEDFGIQSPFTGEIHYPPGQGRWRRAKPALKKAVEEWGSSYTFMADPNCSLPSLVLKGTQLQGGKLVTPDLLVSKSREKAREVLENAIWPEVFFGLDGMGRPALKRYLKDVRKGRVPMTYWADDDYDEPLKLDSQSWDHSESGHSQTGVNELTDIVGSKHGFDTVKPLKLFKKLIQIWCPPNGLVLDPYVGSGTTGHAVLDINYETGSDRKFILIEQGAPENGDKYARTLTWERLKRVINGERADKGGKPIAKADPLGGGFEFRQLTRQIDAKTVLKMKRDELVDVVLTSYWEDDRRNGPALMRLDDMDSPYTHLVGKNDRDEGYFVIWESEESVGRLDRDSYRVILKEGKKANLKPPYHVYARYGIYQSPNVRFYKIPDKILFHLGLNENSDAYNEDDDESDMSEVA